MARSIKNLFFTIIIAVSFFSFYSGLFLIFSLFSDYHQIKNFLFTKGFIVPIISLTPLAFASAIFVSSFFKKKVFQSIHSVGDVFNKLNSIEDLSKIDLSKHDLFFKEYNQILSDMAKFLERIRQIAIDKDVLRSLIKMFEKHMITFENIKDPELFMKKFILECQQFIEVNGFFFLGESDIKNFDIFFTSESDFQAVEIEEILKEHLSGFFLKNELTDSLYEDVLKVSDDCFFKVYFKKIVNVPVLSKCIGGIITKESFIDAKKHFVLEGILSFFINIQVTLKILAKHIEEIEYFSVRDPLTNLFNQKSFWSELDFRIHLAKEYNKKLAILIVDLDNFKKINDKYGHYIGDRILEETGKILKNFFSGNHFISRYGGDEYAGILFDVNLNEAIKIATSLREQINNHKFFVNKELVLNGLTTTIGIAIFPDNAQSAKDLFIFVDNMILKGKRLNKNSIIVPEKDESLTFFKDDAEISLRIIEALKNKKIKFNIQPIYTLSTNNIFGYEVLSKLEIGEIVVKADKFINIINKLKLSTEFDFIVIEKIFKYVYDNKFDKFMFINVTPITLSNSEFIKHLESLADKYSLNNEKIVFEIVERDTVDNLDKLVENCIKIEKMGYKFAIDDFGSGYSSFLYLKALPASFVKVEGNFVKGMRHNLKDRLIVDAITNICKTHNVSVIAEYVEDEEILKEAVNLGIDLGQGFYLRKPEEIET